MALTLTFVFELLISLTFWPWPLFWNSTKVNDLVALTLNLTFVLELYQGQWPCDLDICFWTLSRSVTLWIWPWTWPMFFSSIKVNDLVVLTFVFELYQGQWPCDFNLDLCFWTLSRSATLWLWSLIWTLNFAIPF